MNNVHPVTKLKRCFQARKEGLNLERKEKRRENQGCKGQKKIYDGQGDPQILGGISGGSRVIEGYFCSGRTGVRS